MTETKEYPNSGRFFVNDKMRPDKKDANYNGDGEITCQHCGKKNAGWINIWSKVGAKGDWWSWSFKHKEARGSAENSSGGGSLGRSLSSGSQQDMGYSRDVSPRDQERAKAQGGPRNFGADISDDIPF